MQGEVAFYQKLFNSTIEQAVFVVNDYLNLVVQTYPEISLDVSWKMQDGKPVWTGTFIVVTELGKPDIIYGRVEIVENFMNYPNLIEITIYCQERRFVTWDMELVEYLIRHLPISDITPKKEANIWDAVPDEGWNRRVLELWHKGYSAAVIGERLGYQAQSIYNLLASLRKTYGDEIVPSGTHRRKFRKLSK